MTVVRLEGVVMILDLHRQGLTVSEIARQSGFDRRTIRRYIERGLEARSAERQVAPAVRASRCGKESASAGPLPCWPYSTWCTGFASQQAGRQRGRGVRLWPWSRMTGWRTAHDVMLAARLDGPHASPKGLRHGFGVAADSAGIPLNRVQKWLGHAQFPTTAIYADAVGAKEGHCSADVGAVRAAQPRSGPHGLATRPN